MLQVCQDLLDEAEEFHAFLTTLDPADWGKSTGFMSWTPWDVVAHLHFFDEVSLVAVQGRDPFATRLAELMKQFSKGTTNQKMARDEYGPLEPAELLERWITTCRDLSKQLGDMDPKARLPWFGPDMGVQMFTTARYMETWAHAQEVYDLKGAARKHTDRIKNVATIGVKTFGWTFVNRKEEIPGPPPYVRLTAPSGEVWEWNEPSDVDYVRGDAVDFCHVVTQGRSIGDVSLDVKGPVATRWMEVAQCFAGGPVDPPKPGKRKSGA